MRTALLTAVSRALLMTALAATGPILLTALDADKAEYVGGTLNVPERTEGKLVLSDPNIGKFQFKGGEVAIPFEKITSLEYGQKAGRRIAVAVLVRAC